MAYAFTLQNNTARRYPVPQPSTLNNTYIDYSVRGITFSSNPLQNGGIWVSNEDPTATASTYSKPMKLFNPFIGRFLGSTEQSMTITGNSLRTGEVSGTVNFTASDNALNFIFKEVFPNVYKIFLSEESDPALNRRLLITDVTNSSRVLITDFDPPAQTSLLDCTWLVSKN